MHTPKPTGKPSPGLLDSLLQYYGIELNSTQLKQLWAYHQMLIAANTDSDLTRLHSFDTIVQKHYADCMLTHKLMQKKWPSPLLDMGTGAGFPGFMIKIISPETKIILAEPRPRRVDFLNQVIKELKFKDISVFGHRVTSESFTTPIKGCVTRAFASIEKSLPCLQPSLQKNGLVIFMKGPAVKVELQEFQSPQYPIQKTEYYTIPHTKQQRALIVLQKRS
ncbi:MAG: 16S rRNA (guanine(527)-N(7))-methyltransferase RsmG [Fibrobacteria bacterium]|nr:16S rRNA (guanine(527)-N(7))-methyltransferase RsmG [Fibrobacteria bacterium]